MKTERNCTGLPKWSRVTEKKKSGWLNIREAREANIANLTKLVARLRFKMKEIWAKVSKESIFEI